MLPNLRSIAILLSATVASFSSADLALADLQQAAAQSVATGKPLLIVASGDG